MSGFLIVLCIILMAKNTYANKKATQAEWPYI